jgi:hypothetical protein
VIVVAGVLGWKYLLEPARIDREVARLSALLEAELTEYEAPRERPPYGEPPIEGDGVEWYRQALEACEALDDESEWMRAYIAFWEDGTLPPPDGVPASPEMDRIVDLLAKGARCTKVGRLFSPRMGPYVRLRMPGLLRRLEFDSRLRLHAGDLEGSLDRLLLCHAFVRDALPIPWRSLTNTVEALRDLAGTGRLPGPLRDRLLERLRRNLVDCPSLPEFARDAYLSWQVGLRQVLAGEVSKATVLANCQDFEEKRAFGLVEVFPTRAAILEAWVRLRDDEAAIRAASTDPAALAARLSALDAAVAQEKGGAWVAAALGTFFMINLQIGNHEVMRSEEMAIVLGLLLQREHEATGAWPDTLESIRPEFVDPRPLGYPWSLRFDPETGLPGLYLRGLSDPGLNLFGSSMSDDGALLRFRPAR